MLREIREASPNTELKCVESLVAVAKFLYHKESKYQSREQVVSKRVGYRDIPIIEELRRLECEIMARVNTHHVALMSPKNGLSGPCSKPVSSV